MQQRIVATLLHAVPAKITYVVLTADMMGIIIIWRMFFGGIIPIALALLLLEETPMMITSMVRERRAVLLILKMRGALAIPVAWIPQAILTGPPWDFQVIGY
jgi:hypothetical protein